MLSKMKPGVYGDRSKVELSGELAFLKLIEKLPAAEIDRLVELPLDRLEEEMKQRRLL